MTLTHLIPAPVKPGLKLLRQKIRRSRWITQMRRRWVTTFYRFHRAIDVCREQRPVVCR